MYFCLNHVRSPFPLGEGWGEASIIRITNKTDQFSALNGIGIDDLKQQILDAIKDEEQPDVVVNARHKESLEQALTDIRRAIQALNDDIPTDLVAEDLRLCISHLSEIVGKELMDPNTVLGNIFKHFCIGK